MTESFGQNRIVELEYKKVRSELEKSSNSLNTNLFLPRSDFYIGLTKDQIVENIEMNPCIDISSDNIKNQKIISALAKMNLLDDLFIRSDLTYTSLLTGQQIEKSNSKLIVDLFFVSQNLGMINCFIPIFDQNKAKELVTEFEGIFESNSCFKELKEKI
ncbi:MAG: hypothetical protein ACFB15_13265 [Cyclobacteriaceae bacterium]